MTRPEALSSQVSWADKTMSVLQAQQYEARLKRLRALPRFSLFDRVTDEQGELLYLISYEGQTHPSTGALHTVEGLRALVLERLPREALLLAPQEYSVLTALLNEGGKVPLYDGFALSGAESLVRRLWCTVRAEGDELFAHLPRRLSVRLADLISTAGQDEYEARLGPFHAGIYSALNMYGAVTADSALSILMLFTMRRGIPADPTLCLRLLKAAYPYVYNSRGQLVLTHPGLADPAAAAEKARDIDLSRLAHTQDDPIPQQMMLSDAERDAALAMSGMLGEALRPDLSPLSATEDLRILIKQGVPYEQLREVLASQLEVRPTSSMLDTLRLMQAHTPPWLVHTPGRVH